MKKFLPNIFPFILLSLLIVMWGSAFAALKVSLETIPPLWVMSLRLIIGSLTIATFFLILRKSLPLTFEFWKWCLIIGFLGFSFPFSIISWGTQFIPSSLVAILMGANPIVTLILAYFFLVDSKLTIRMVIGVFLGLLGIILLVGFGNIDADLYKREFIYGQLAYFFSNSSLIIHEISLKSSVSIALLGVFPTGIASVIWFKVIELKGPVFLALVNYLIPVWALILGIFLLNEKINFIIGFGLIFITIGIWLIEKRVE